jgi:hypothetical protein
LTWYCGIGLAQAQALIMAIPEVHMVVDGEERWRFRVSLLES